MRKHLLAEKILTELDPFAAKNISMISIVTQGEMLSLCYQFGWGDRKTDLLRDLFNQFLVIPIEAEDLVKAYAEIDTYSLGKHPEKKLPSGLSSRVMGKNDLWVAATGHVTSATLLTTDPDFDHLNQVYLPIIKYGNSPK